MILGGELIAGLFIIEHEIIIEHKIVVEAAATLLQCPGYEHASIWGLWRSRNLGTSMAVPDLIGRVLQRPGLNNKRWREAFWPCVVLVQGSGI